MPLSDYDIELIDGYLKSSLNEEQKSEFEKRLELTDFKNAVKSRKLPIAFMKAENKAAIKKEIADIASKIPSKKTNRKWYLAAASMVVMFVVAYTVYFTVNSFVDLSEIYKQYYEPYPISIQRSGEQQVPIALRLYNAGNYKQAIRHLTDISDEQNSLYYLYLGSCYLELNNTDEALASFLQAAKSDDVVIRQHANWYVAMTHLKMKDATNTILVLNEIVEGQGIYTSRAQNLYNRINR